MRSLRDKIEERKWKKEEARRRKREAARKRKMASLGILSGTCVVLILFCFVMGYFYDDETETVTDNSSEITTEVVSETETEQDDTKEVSEEVCEILSDAAGLKDVSLEVTGDTGLIMGARKLLYEIVYNLCDSAIKYNVHGGKVKISVSEEPGKVCLAVQDTGIGIAPEEHSKIFERFYRVDKSHSKQSGGTGLGLSIVKHAAQYHQADISVESEIDKGTTVLVVFKRL